MPLRPSVVRLVVACLVAGAAGRAHAIEDVTTPRALGLGGAVRSLATGALGPLVNPAGMPLVRQYTVEALYGFGVQDLGSTVHLSVVDTVTSRVAAGVYYSFVHGSPQFSYGYGRGDARATDAVREGHETGLAIAIPIGERFVFGFTSKYVRVATDVANPAWSPTAPMGTPKRITVDSTTTTASADGFTVDTGIALRLGDTFSLGIVGQNLIPLRSVDAPLNLAGGLSWHPGDSFYAAFDVAIDFDRYRARATVDGKGQVVPGDSRTTVRLAGGLEYLIAGHVPVRLGLSHDGGMPGTFLHAGVGYVHRSFGIDLGYRQKVDGGVEAQLMAGLRLFVE